MGSERPIALVVEDEYDISRIVKSSLEAAGYDAEVVHAGDTALAWLGTTVPRLVVLDLMLPGVGGEEVLKFIRGEDKFAETKVIISTAFGDMADSLRAGADWILLKPLDYKRLKELASHLLPDSER